MEKNKSVALAALALVLCTAMAGAYLLYGSESPGPDISDSQAMEIVLSEPSVSDYYSSYFTVEDWRVTTASLVGETPNGSTSEKGVWKVEVMERTCACSGVKDLLVIEGYVSASNGELFDFSTKFVSESEYDKETCASTACH